MGRLLKVTAILVFAMGTLHCANKKNYGTKAAPSSEKQLGLIVKTDEEGLGRLINKNPEAQVRTLNSKNGIYEVSNVSIADAQSISTSPVYKNKFIQGLKKSETQKLSLKNLAKNTSDDANAALATCLESPQQPELKVDISFDPDTFTIKLGQEVTITANGTANETIGGDVRFLWDILPPGFSKQAFSVGITTQQKFTPDSVGLYQVAVIAQGADLSCNVQVIPILVTSNPEITSDTTPLPRPDDLSLFTHLSYINAEDAWKKSTGKDITVAILDTGVNYNHKGIRSNISINKTETLDDNDDDNNGFADDNIGWDFVSNDRFPFDDEGHGSHVSGLVASPVLGVAPDAKIIPVKVLNAAGGSDLATVVAGIYYAVDSGADIINASLGFESLTEVPLPLLDALEYARSKNVIFLAASGNGGQSGIGFDIKAQPTYPATFNLDNMINVAATALNQITSYSNFSEELVHVAAPGGNENEFVVSLATENPAKSFLAGQAGTSMACPVTAGVVALMLSSDKTGLSPTRIREILMETGNELATLKGKTVSGKQVNALKAVQAVLDLQPASSLL